MLLIIESTPDNKGRQSCTLEWTTVTGAYRHDIHKDGQPVGYRRGQCFHTIVADLVRQEENKGNTVKIKELHGKFNN